MRGDRMIYARLTKPTLSAAFSERDENPCAYSYIFPFIDKFIGGARLGQPRVSAAHATRLNVFQRVKLWTLLFINNLSIFR